jgi:hypothetical protein
MSKLNVIVGDKTFEGWGKKTILTSEAIAIEKAYGKNFAQFTTDIDEGSIYALQVLAWSLLRRSDPGLKVGGVDMPIGDIRLETVCETCGRRLVAKVSDEEVDGVTIRELVIRDGLIVRIHEDDETDECSDAESNDPFEPGSSEAGQDSSTTNGLGISETSPTSSE